MTSISQDTVALVAALDAQAQTIIDSFHAQYPPGRLQPGQDMPRAPEELKELWAERTNIILSQVATLQAALSPAVFQAVQTYVTSTTSGNVKTIPFSPQQVEFLRAIHSNNKGVGR